MFSISSRSRGPHRELFVLPQVHISEVEETSMDKSIWIAAGALTAWLMIGAAAML